MPISIANKVPVIEAREFVLQSMISQEFKRTMYDRWLAEPEKYNIDKIHNCLNICIKEHFGQKDKAGEYYWRHPISVATMCNGWKEVCVALLHDVLEDCEVSAQDLLNEAVPQEVVNAVELLTKNPGEPNSDYLNRLIDSGDEVAVAVKLNDIKHNMSRLDNINDYKTRKRLKNKYYKYLNLFEKRGVI